MSDFTAQLPPVLISSAWLDSVYLIHFPDTTILLQPQFPCQSPPVLTTHTKGQGRNSQVPLLWQHSPSIIPRFPLVRRRAAVFMSIFTLAAAHMTGASGWAVFTAICTSGKIFM